MNIDTNLFKIKTNNVLPSRGKILISEPFLADNMFGRSVVLLIDHTDDGSMGLILNKPYPLFLNDLIDDLTHLDLIPLYKGGPMAPDTLFYIHRLSHITGALPIEKGLYLNGNFEEIKNYLLEGNPSKGVIRFFLGYSGWESRQLSKELEEDTWLVSRSEQTFLMDTDIKEIWKEALISMGNKYKAWARFPQVPSLN
ncbi:MAG: YqgE/AlgH family protein [Bacteroides sp.]